MLGQWLANALGACEISFLVVDFSGRALIHLGHAGALAATRTQGRETAERVPLAGSPHGLALAYVVIANLLKAADGDLRDDATAMCVDRHGGAPRERSPRRAPTGSRFAEAPP